MDACRCRQTDRSATTQLQVMLESDRPKPRGPAQLKPWETPGPEADRYVPYTKVVNGSFLVAAYRRPDFRVDVTLTGDAAHRRS